ncbi:uncharacterized protein LOC116338096 [Contarinia nasturtii]|uniref:uncharacterized protein LOC116338096 n=1 Tax=Contarinia nasturtii TaxID=265458 RepID=UPI0012D3E263|nr:uncharacterized protein LOC116338096 [Contarinia nasturtii]XP_031619032.1 uncharacterized protein LOC116338096 [Contarinia nasturtii]
MVKWFLCINRNGAFGYQKWENYPPKMGNCLSKVMYPGFVSQFIDIYAFANLVLVIWGIVTVCGTMMMIHIGLSQDPVDWPALLITIWQLFWTFAFLFLYCYRGEEVSYAFEELADEISQCEWDSFPYQLQRILPTVLIAAQDSVQIKTYGYACTHERFQKIVNGGYSYYAILREFY